MLAEHNTNTRPTHLSSDDGIPTVGQPMVWVVGLTLTSLMVAGMSLVFPKLGKFFDPLSLLVVLGGTLTATSIHCSTRDVKLAIRTILGFLESLWEPKLDSRSNPEATLSYFLRLARMIKRDGVLVLEREASRAPDPFLRYVLGMALDDRPEEEFRKLILQEMATRGLERERIERTLSTMALYAPAMGLVGTLLGLIGLLGDLSDSKATGPALSLAIVSTLHGAVLAYGLLSPLAGRLARDYHSDIIGKHIILEGVCALRREESPRQVEERLRTLIPQSSTSPLRVASN